MGGGRRKREEAVWGEGRGKEGRGQNLVAHNGHPSIR